MLEEIVGWPCFRSLLSFAGFSFSSSFESKQEKQPIPPNQIKKHFYLSKTKNNSRCIQTQSTGSYSNPIITQIPITTPPKFWVSLSLSPINLGTMTRDWQKKKPSKEKRQSERIQVSWNTTNNNNKEKQRAKQIKIAN